MDTSWIVALQAALDSGRPCALLTIAATRGSVPRQAGTKMLVFADGTTEGTIGGGKFEALAVEAALTALAEQSTALKSYPLREGEEDSFGAICGGEVTVLIEVFGRPQTLTLVGAGHCAQAIAQLASNCGWQVVVLDDRSEMRREFPAGVRLIENVSPPEFISRRNWADGDALVLVSRNYLIDREALGAAVRCGGMGYLGMIGSQRKVLRVFDELLAEGVDEKQLGKVHAPLGLDIGADSPAEIAVSVLAEIYAVMRGRPARSFREAR